MNERRIRRRRNAQAFAVSAAVTLALGYLFASVPAAVRTPVGAAGFAVGVGFGVRAASDVEFGASDAGSDGGLSGKGIVRSAVIGIGTAFLGDAVPSLLPTLVFGAAFGFAAGFAGRVARR